MHSSKQLRYGLRSGQKIKRRNSVSLQAIELTVESGLESEASLNALLKRLPVGGAGSKQIVVARFLALLLAITTLLQFGVAPRPVYAAKAAADCCGPSCPVTMPVRYVDCCRVVPQRAPVRAAMVESRRGKEMRTSALTFTVAHARPLAPGVKSAYAARTRAQAPPAAMLHRLCSLQI